MLNVTEQTKAAFTTDAVPKELSVYFPNLNLTFINADIESESLTLEETINPENNLAFVGCASSTFSVRIAGVTQDLRNEYFLVNIVGGETESIPLFQGYVIKQTLSQEDMLTEIQACDLLYRLENVDVKAWYDSLTFPMTLKEFRDSFFLEVGIAQETTTLVNDNLELSNTIKTSTLNARDVAKWICQANGRFGIINRDGAFRYVKLSANATPDLELTKSDYIRMAHERYTVQPIDYVRIFDSAGNYEGYGSTEDNPLCISNNPIAYGLPMSTAAQNIYGEVVGLAYTPLEIEARGLPYVEVGDSISVETTLSEVSTFILNRTLKGIQGLFDTYASTGEEYQPQFKETAEGTNLAQERFSRILGDETNSAAILIESDRITAEVQRATDAESTLSTTFSATADGLQVQINELYSELDGETQLYYTDYVPTLLNYPAWDFTYNIPCNDTVQLADDLKFEYREAYYRKNLRAIVYDEEDSVTYRFVKTNGEYVWQEVSNTETSLILSRLTTLEATTEGIQTEVTEISADLEDNYYNINTLDTKFTQTANAITTEATARQSADTSLSTRITQTANGLSAEISDRQNADSTMSASISANASAISTEVSNRASADEALSSRITANAESIVAEVQRATEEEGKKYTIQSGIAINANGIEISGSKYVKIKSNGSFSVDSGNFSIDGSGNVTVKGTVVTSNITASGGSIGNFTLDTALKNGMTSLSDTTHNGIYLGSDGIALGKGAFKVTNSGALTATNASIKGYVNATSGYVGGFVIGTNQLSYRPASTNYNLISGFEENSLHHVRVGATSEYLEVYGNPVYIQASTSGTAITVTSGIDITALTGTIDISGNNVEIVGANSLKIGGKSVTWMGAQSAVQQNKYVLVGN